MLRLHDEASGGTRLFVDRRYRGGLCKPRNDAVATNDANDANIKHNDWPERHCRKTCGATGSVANRGGTR